jgi:hypothetical protein
MQVEFEWHVSAPDAKGQVHVRERLCGTDRANVYGPMPPQIADSFIKARRVFCRRFITNRGAIQVFEPRLQSHPPVQPKQG